MSPPTRDRGLERTLERTGRELAAAVFDGRWGPAPMTPEELRAYCLGLNGTVEERPFPRAPGLSAFKVGGRIFAFCALDEQPLRVSLKCEPELAVQLREANPAITPGYHLNKRHWNTVLLDGTLPERMVRDLIEDSYDLVVAGLPRRERLLLDRP